MPSHYLEQCWDIVNWTLRNKLQWNFNRNSDIFIEENALANVVCEMASICLGLNVLRGVNKRWSFPVMTLCHNNRHIRTITLNSITVSQCSVTNEIYFSPIARIRPVPGRWPRLQVNALSDNDISNTKRQVGVRWLLRDPWFPQMLNASLLLGDDPRKRYFWNEKKGTS